MKHPFKKNPFSAFGKTNCHPPAPATSPWLQTDIRFLHVFPSEWIVRLFLVLWLTTLSLLPGTAHAAITDTLSLPADDEEMIFQIKWARLQRLRAGQTDTLPLDITQAIHDADSAALGDDYVVAVAYLDLALEFLEQHAFTATPPYKASHIWGLEAIAGTDLWQQKYSISLVDQDSAIYENQGNPYTGLRLTYRGTDHRGAILRMQTEGKYGHEYGSGTAELGFEAPIGAKVSVQVADRLEGTHYQREKSLRYWNNQFLGRLNWHPLRPLTIALEREEQGRRYLYPSTFFTSYHQSQTSLRAGGEWRDVLRSEIRFDRRQRDYRETPEQAYSENILTLFWYPLGLRAWSLRGMVQSRNRNYGSGFIDSLLTNDFQEWYVQSLFSIGSTSALSLQLSTSWNKKSYVHPDQATPDYLDLIIEPTLHYMLNGHYTLKAGYRFRQKEHQSADIDGSESVGMENFQAHAPVVGFEMICGTVLVNLYDVYEIRQYAGTLPAEYTLYSDRDIHSLFFYLAWTISGRWTFNAMINLDQDLARNEQGSDARSNILNFELLYKF